jgi:putative FmdB family regulatory protein
MPIYEFECKSCGHRFDELLKSGAESAACPECGSDQVRRRFTPPSPPSRQPRGAKVRDSESRRREREAARRDRLAETKKKRARGEMP